MNKVTDAPYYPKDTSFIQRSMRSSAHAVTENQMQTYNDAARRTWKSQKPKADKAKGRQVKNVKSKKVSTINNPQI